QLATLDEPFGIKLDAAPKSYCKATSRKKFISNISIEDQVEIMEKRLNSHECPFSFYNKKPSYSDVYKHLLTCVKELNDKAERYIISVVLNHQIKFFKYCNIKKFSLIYDDDIPTYNHFKKKIGDWCSKKINF
ncbi:hypothetical protein COBT_001034, partial [Conglomerata obtusa]